MSIAIVGTASEGAALLPLWTALVSAAAVLLASIINARFQAGLSKEQSERDRTIRREEREAVRTEAAETRAKEASLSALDIADELESYALACANVVADNTSQNSYEPEPRGFHLSVPDAPQFPKSVDWRLIGAAEASRIRSLKTEIELTNLQIRGTVDYVGGEEAAEESANLSAELGLRCWSIAEELRLRHNLPPQDTGQLPRNFRDTLERQRAEVLKRRRAVDPSDELG